MPAVNAFTSQYHYTDNARLFVLYSDTMFPRLKCQGFVLVLTSYLNIARTSVLYLFSHMANYKFFLQTNLNKLIPYGTNGRLFATDVSAKFKVT